MPFMMRLVTGLALAALCATGPARAEPLGFATAEAAAAALSDALRRDDTEALLDLFGRENAEIVLGADPASGRVTRRRAAAALAERLVLRRDGDDQVTLVFGRTAWPMAIPLVRDGGAWRFDADAGLEEIRARRIGEDELAAIDALKVFVAAERDYAARRRAAGGGPEYARFVQSTEGATDGLWWDKAMTARAGAPPLAGFAARNEDFLAGRRPGDPFRGYYYRILTGQGPHAPGGAMSYLEGGRMTKGFAMIAWPADYGSSGIKTFLVGPDGRVVENDLGEESGIAAPALRLYDPGPGWTPVER